MKDSLKEGGDLLSHLVAVPSALTGLTSLFGMERGGPRRHGHLSLIVKGAVHYFTVYLDIIGIKEGISTI